MAVAPIQPILTMNYLLNQFLGELERAGKSPETVKTYASILKPWSGCALSDITKESVRMYLDQRLREKRSKATLRMDCVAMQLFVRWCEAEDYQIDGRILDLKATNVKPPDIETLSIEELQALVKAVRSRKRAYRPVRDELMIRTFYMTGLRLAEMVNLMPADIQVSAGGTFINVRKGKGSKQRLFGPVEKDLAKELLAFTSTVLPARKGGRLFGIGSTQGMADSVNRIAAKAKLGRTIHPHLFRHTFATNFLRENPGQLRTLQLLLGHSTLTMTLRYEHLVNAEILGGGWKMRDPGKRVA